MNKDLVIKHFKIPADYTIPVWNDSLELASDMGCDWLDWFVDQVGFAPAGEAVSELCERIEELEQKNNALEWIAIPNLPVSLNQCPRCGEVATVKPPHPDDMYPSKGITAAVECDCCGYVIMLTYQIDHCCNDDKQIEELNRRMMKIAEYAWNDYFRQIEDNDQ